MIESAVAFGDLPDASGAADVTDELLAACVHCGFCIPVCPTWDILREENDSPRGRLYLMRAESEGRVQAGGAFSLHLGRCLGCRACESVCPAGVPFGHLLERARARIPPRPAAHWWERWMLEALTTPRRARVTYAVARFLRNSGVADILGRLLPGNAGGALRLLSASRPTFGTTRASAVGIPATRLEVQDGEALMAETQAYVLLSGCVMEGLFGHVHDATRRTLARAGYREVEAPGQVCCGALHAHAGLLEEAREQARHNIRVFESVDCEWIVTDSAGCGAGLKDYPAWLSDDPDWRDRAEALAARVKDVTEILADAVTKSDGTLGSSPGAELPGGRVGYDAPCHLHHAQGVRDDPLVLLRSLPGFEVEALPSSDRCCGGAGMYNLVQPDLAALVLAPKLGEIERGRYDWIATGNPGCIMYLGAGLMRVGDRTPVVHPVELVDHAWSDQQEEPGE